MILSKSIKDHIVSSFYDLSTSKEIYDKLVKLYFISTSGQTISLRNKLYKIRISKNEDMATYIMKISQIRDQLQGLEEIIYDLEMTTYVINDFPLEWSSFATIVYSRNDIAPFYELWAQFILEETRLKEEDDYKSNEKSQAFVFKSKEEEREVCNVQRKTKYVQDKMLWIQ